MSRLNPEPQHRPGGPAPFQAADEEAMPERDPDFAEEHDSTSYAGDLSGGPEGAREPESPRGLAGMDPS